HASVSPPPLQPDNEVEIAKHQIAQKSLDTKRAQLEFGQSFDNLPEYTFAQVAQLSSAGRHLVVIDGYVHDVAHFVATHPGGRLALLNQVGKTSAESTAAFNAAHAHSAVALEWMRAMRVGRLKE
ncbi:MAG: cytochrome b5 domain-containing protein, partial [Opitutales bacterium]|nr:cytochrome b5 domain-containing protein [Opitutales bacterium]